jgi:hypothetical protein
LRPALRARILAARKQPAQDALLVTAIGHHPALTIAARIAGAVPRRLLGQRAPRSFPVLPLREFHDVFANALPALTQARLAHFLEVPVDRAPWFDTGIDLENGEWISWFANGEVVLSRLLDIRFGADFQLWARVGEDGTVFRATRTSHTLRAPRSGRLYLASLFPGAWADPLGDLLTPADVYKAARGSLSLWLLRWSGEPGAELRRLCAICDPGHAVSGEIARRESSLVPPAQWSALWALGDSEIYRAQGDCIACRTQGDVAILQRAVDVPLRPGTRLAWEWRVDALPSRFAEHTLPTHDYLSIAVEFDNGIDLTWYWSARLPAGFGYWCPLPTWDKREFHVVIRSGTGELGQWLCESRDLHADYQRYIGAPPARIVRVWLIAVSLFQREGGSCDYRAIRLEQGDSVTRLSP